MGSPPTLVRLRILEEDADAEEVRILADRLRSAIGGVDGAAVTTEDSSQPARTHGLDVLTDTTRSESDLVVGVIVVALSRSPVLIELLRTVERLITERRSSGRETAVDVRIGDDGLTVREPSPQQRRRFDQLQARLDSSGGQRPPAGRRRG